MVQNRVPVLGLGNLVRQLRHLACRRVSLTTLSSIKIPVLVLFYWYYMRMILSSLGVTPKVYYILNPFFIVSFQ